MTIDGLFAKCDITVLTEGLMDGCEPFSCGDSEEETDLNEFFARDSMSFQKRLLGKTYVLTLKQPEEDKRPKRIVTFFTLANDSIRLTNKFADEYKELFLEDTDLRDKSIKRFPCILLGRLGTDKDFRGQGYGSAVMSFIKYMFISHNRTGCRFIIVDALNNENTLSFYKNNGFHYLIEDERLEAKFVGIGVGRLPLNTRLMYFDLLTLKD